LSPKLAQKRVKGSKSKKPGAGLSDGCKGNALSEIPAFQPYWGKPAVWNEGPKDPTWPVSTDRDGANFRLRIEVRYVQKRAAANDSRVMAPPNC